MAQSQRRLTQEASPSKVRHGKYHLDFLDPKRIAKHLVAFQPTEAAVADVMAKARLTIPDIAETADVLRVLRYNPICMMALARKSKYDPENPVAEGFVGFLPLNKMGMQALALGYFSGVCPDLRFIAKPDERPACIRMWAVYAPGPLSPGMALFMEQMASPQFAGLDLYSRATTEAGINYHQVLGFTHGAQIGSIWVPELWVFPRAPRRPLYDTYVPGAAAGEIGITVARTFDDLMRVIAIRDAVYIGEQECPYNEEYDGNDLAAAHLLAYIGDEPVGCLRLRFFADFAKFERVAIRKEFRKSRAAIKLAQAGLKFCQKKGYRRVIGHAQARLASFWTRFGFRPMEDRKRFVFSDYEYIEMVAELDPDPDAVVLGADPYLMIRPEGRWHVPGILEQSVSRAATTPSVAKKS